MLKSIRFAFRHKLVSIPAALLALTGGVALAAWVIITMTPLGPSAMSTATLETHVVNAFNVSDCTTPVTTVPGITLSGAGPGTVVQGQVCLQNGRTPAGSQGFTLSPQNTNATLAAGLIARVTTTGTFASPSLGTSCTLPSLSPDGVTALGVDAQMYMGPLSGITSPLQTLTTTLNRQRICITVVLPTNASTSLAGLSNNFTLDIDAQ